MLNAKLIWLNVSKQEISNVAHSLALLTLACWSSPSGGEEADASPAANRQAIHLSDLPPPPEMLAALIKRGEVTFFVGPRAAAAANRYSSNPSAAKVDAETDYQLGFDYRCQSRWRVRRSSGRRMLLVNVSYQRIKLKRSHEIRFRKRPDLSSFWDSRLVRHEFDHVKLSSDPTIDKRFVDKLRAGDVISEEITAATEVTDSYVRGVIDRHVNRVFDEIIDLINIRYKELDRQTDHGLRPLPENSSLAEWLQ